MLLLSLVSARQAAAISMRDILWSFRRANRHIARRSGSPTIRRDTTRWLCIYTYIYIYTQARTSRATMNMQQSRAATDRATLDLFIELTLLSLTRHLSIFSPIFYSHPPVCVFAPFCAIGRYSKRGTCAFCTRERRRNVSAASRWLEFLILRYTPTVCYSWDTFSLSDSFFFTYYFIALEWQ